LRRSDGHISFAKVRQNGHLKSEYSINVTRAEALPSATPIEASMGVVGRGGAGAGDRFGG